MTEGHVSPRRLPNGIPYEGTCGICGNTEFDCGYLKSRHPVKYVDDSDSIITKMTPFGSMDVSVRRCRSCGNIQLFA